MLSSARTAGAATTLKAAANEAARAAEAVFLTMINLL
jgi:hypothetical protein